MATMTETDKPGPKQKTPLPLLKEELIAIKPVAQAHCMAVEAQGVESEEHERVISRAIEQGKRGRSAAGKKALDELGMKHCSKIWKIQRARYSTLQKSNKVLGDTV